VSPLLLNSRAENQKFQSVVLNRISLPTMIPVAFWHFRSPFREAHSAFKNLIVTSKCDLISACLLPMKFVIASNSARELSVHPSRALLKISAFRLTCECRLAANWMYETVAVFKSIKSASRAQARTACSQSPLAVC
jgi:hypothetical protein